MEMDFTPICKDLLFSIRLEGKDKSEFDQAIYQWSDLNYLIDFFSKCLTLVNTQFWIDNEFPVEDPVDLAVVIRKEAIALNQYFNYLNYYSIDEAKEILDQIFKPLDGEYIYVSELIPQKAYGINRPSMLRLYAIKLADGTYVIVHGDIKLTKKMKDTPGLHEIVTKKINDTLRFFKLNGIMEKIDLV